MLPIEFNGVKFGYPKHKSRHQHSNTSHMEQDSGYSYHYLRHDTKVSLSDPSYRDVTKTLVEDFESMSSNFTKKTSMNCTSIKGA